MKAFQLRRREYGWTKGAGKDSRSVRMVFNVDDRGAVSVAEGVYGSCSCIAAVIVVVIADGAC